MDGARLLSASAGERMRLVAVQARARARLAGLLDEACAGSGSDWPARLSAAIAASIGFAADSPEEARLLLPDAVSIEVALGAGAQQTQEALVDMLRRGRRHSLVAARMPELTEQAMVGAATSLLAGKLRAGEAAELPSLQPALTQFMLTPYVDQEHARRLALVQ